MTTLDELLARAKERLSEMSIMTDNLVIQATVTVVLDELGYDWHAGTVTRRRRGRR